MFWCSVCHDNEVPHAGDTCARCQTDLGRGYRVRTLKGRCANGAERDHGTLQHAIITGHDDAMCGRKPGRRSVGWSTWLPTGENQPTCPRCLKHIENAYKDERTTIEKYGLLK